MAVLPLVGSVPDFFFALSAGLRGPGVRWPDFALFAFATGIPFYPVLLFTCRLPRLTGSSDTFSAILNDQADSKPLAVWLIGADFSDNATVQTGQALRREA